MYLQRDGKQKVFDFFVKYKYVHCGNTKVYMSIFLRIILYNAKRKSFLSSPPAGEPRRTSEITGLILDIRTITDISRVTFDRTTSSKWYTNKCTIFIKFTILFNNLDERITEEILSNIGK